MRLIQAKVVRITAVVALVFQKIMRLKQASYTRISKQTMPG